MVRWLSVSLVVIALDQMTKFWATHSLSYGQQQEVLPILNWTLLHNTGAAFSFLADAGGWQRWFFILISLAVSVVLLVMLIRTASNQIVELAGLALVLGGALGNLWDRLALGYVIDFIQVHYQDHFFPAFNVADSAITVGAIALIFGSFFHSRIRYNYSPDSRETNGSDSR